jgi:hypothetical protein
MMDDGATMAIVTLAVLAGVLVAAFALLRGWRGWLDLKREELALRDAGPVSASPGARIELADLKERVRRLEAIANGVEG